MQALHRDYTSLRHWLRSNTGHFPDLLELQYRVDAERPFMLRLQQMLPDQVAVDDKLMQHVTKLAASMKQMMVATAVRRSRQNWKVASQKFVSEKTRDVLRARLRLAIVELARELTMASSTTERLCMLATWYEVTRPVRLQPTAA